MDALGVVDLVGQRALGPCGILVAAIGEFSMANDNGASFPRRLPFKLAPRTVVGVGSQSCTCRKRSHDSRQRRAFVL